MTLLNSFLYRLPRIAISFPFPVAFQVGTRKVAGQCLNLSNRGLLAEFRTPVAEGVTGCLSLQPADYLLEVPSKVAHTEGFRAGLHFRFTTAEQEHLIRALVEAVSTVRQESG